MKGFFRLDIPPHVADVVRALPPDVKHGLKAALRLLTTNPAAGEPLRRELAGYSKYRVRRFRIVYQTRGRVVRILAVGHRRTVYEDLGARFASSKRSRER